MFDVPHSDGLRMQFTVGLEALGSVVFKVRDVIADEQITLEGFTAERPVYTLSVAAGRGATTRVTVCVTQSVRRTPVPFDEASVRQGLGSWLRALRHVIESGQLLANTIPAAMQSACLALKRLEQCQAVVATALVDTQPWAVWDTIRAPDALVPDQRAAGVYQGYVPGAPIGMVGELRYFIDALPHDDFLRGCVRIVTDYEEPRRIVMRCVPPLDEVTFSLRDEAGQTRLELLYRKRMTTLDVQAEVAHIARWAQTVVDSYKIVAESTATT
jgi:hypothetical protein